MVIDILWSRWLTQWWLQTFCDPDGWLSDGYRHSVIQMADSLMEAYILPLENWSNHYIAQGYASTTLLADSVMVIDILWSRWLIHWWKPIIVSAQLHQVPIEDWSHHYIAHGYASTIELAMLHIDHSTLKKYVYLLNAWTPHYLYYVYCIVMTSKVYVWQSCHVSHDQPCQMFSLYLVVQTTWKLVWEWGQS